MAHRGMNFGVFLAPYHKLGENPTLSLARDLELVEWADYLGYDEAWMGEHHSGGWEVIGSPEIFIAHAIARTRHIRLGSGVTSLPYHHPFIVAEQFVQLDHMSRGRVMLGCGPGALPSDAWMMGIEPVQQRPRMDEALGAILRLLECGEPVTMKTDWFEMREARLHLRPYSDPRFPIVVASTVTPSGMIAAGKHGVGVISVAAGVPGGPDTLADHWKIAEDTAAQHGKTMNRKDWRVVVKMHVAPTDEQAMAEVRAGEKFETSEYHVETLGRPASSAPDPLAAGIAVGTTIIGSPDTVARGIQRLIDYTQGGFGALLFWANEWASREETLRSLELFARYVMPRFQGSLETLERSNKYVRENRATIMGKNVEAIRRAFTDHGREVPTGVRERTVGARDVDFGPIKG